MKVREWVRCLPTYAAAPPGGPSPPSPAELYRVRTTRFPVGVPFAHSLPRRSLHHLNTRAERSSTTTIQPSFDWAPGSEAVTLLPRQELPELYLCNPPIA